MGIFHNPSALRISDKPYRNWDSVAIGVTIAVFASTLLSCLLIDSSQLLKEPFLLHLKVVLTNWPVYYNQVVPLFTPLAFVKTWGLFIFIFVFSQLAAFAFFGREINPLIHIRGRRWLKGKEALAEAKRASKHWLQNSLGEIEILKWVWLTSDRLLKSILLVGSQGGGKTQVMNLLLTQALNFGHKALIFDPTKGDYVRWVKNRVLVSSTDRRSVHPWLGYDIYSVEDAQAFSEGLIEASDQPMWSNSARMILTGVLVHLQKIHEKNWSWPQLAEILADEVLIQEACQSYPPASPLVADLESKTTQSILLNLLAYTEMIYTLAKNFRRIEGKRFSFVNFILNDDSKTKVVVFAMNQRSPADAAYARALVNLITRRVGSLEFSESKKRKSGLWLDEIIQFGKLENIAKTMEVGRSKGLYVVAATQDFSQISKIYGQDELQKWDALFGLKVFMEIAGQESQEFVSKSVGQREIQLIQRTASGNGSGKGNVNISSGLSSPQKRDVILPAEMATFGKRKNGIESLWVGYSPNYVLSLTTPFVNPPDAFKPFVPWPKIPINQPPQQEQNTDRVDFTEAVIEPQKPFVIEDVKKAEPSFFIMEEAPARTIYLDDSFNHFSEEDEQPPTAEDAVDDYLTAAAGLDHTKEVLEVIDMILPEPPPPSTGIILPAQETTVQTGEQIKRDRKRKPRNYQIAET